MDQQQECVEIVEQALPLALGRVYAQYILPDGYKVSQVIQLHQTTGCIALQSTLF